MKLRLSLDTILSKLLLLKLLLVVQHIDDAHFDIVKHFQLIPFTLSFRSSNDRAVENFEF